MSEIKIDNPEKLAEWQVTNNMDVNNLTQLCAILMKHEELLKQVLAFASDNIKNFEQALENAHDRIDQMQQIISKIEDREHKPIDELYDKCISYLRKIEELETKNKILELWVSHD